MRITRAYTITHEVKRILDTKPNKSDYICRAVRKLHTQEEAFNIADVNTVQLKVVLHNRICGCHKTADCGVMNLLRKL